jgi:hypothetical protein
MPILPCRFLIANLHPHGCSRIAEHFEISFPRLLLRIERMIYRQIHAYQTNPSAVIVCEREALSIRRADEVIGCDNDGFILEGPDVGHRRTTNGSLESLTTKSAPTLVGDVQTGDARCFRIISRDVIGMRCAGRQESSW